MGLLCMFVQYVRRVYAVRLPVCSPRTLILLIEVRDRDACCTEKVSFIEYACLLVLTTLSTATTTEAQLTASMKNAHPPIPNFRSARSSNSTGCLSGKGLRCVTSSLTRPQPVDRLQAPTASERALTILLIALYTVLPFCGAQP
jgi:hypothetical protein